MTLLYDLIMIIDCNQKKNMLQIFGSFSRQENVAAAKFDGRDSEQRTFLFHGFMNKTLEAYLPTAQISEQNSQFLLSYFMDLHSAYIIIIIIIIIIDFYLRGT